MNAPYALSLPDDALGPRGATMGQRVYDALRRAIVQMQLRPGNPLSEAEVARQLGVSRQPVREAFIKLSEVGLVEIRPQRGTFVVMISRRDVENARFIREAIEVAVARKAAEEASPDDLVLLAELVERQEEASAADDRIGFMRFDEAFHQAIAAAAGTEHAWRVLENLKAQMDRVRFLALPAATPTAVLVEQHRAILEAIAAHAPERAEAAMRVHLTEILKSLPRLATAHPDLFSD